MSWNRSGAAASALCVALSGCNLVVQTISEYGGAPIAGVQVQVDDQPWAMTDAEGQASFEPPGGSYTLRVLQPTDFTTASGRRYVTWDLLEIDGPPGNPVVLQVEGTFVPHRSAVLSGAVSGTGGGHTTVWLQGGGTSGRYAALWLQGSGVFRGAAEARPDGTFEMPSVEWEGGDGREATLHALLDDGASFPGTHYLAYGSAPLTLSDPSGTGGSITGLAVQLHDIREEAAHAEVSIPAGLSWTAQASLSIKLAEGWAGLEMPVSVPGSFDLQVPQLPGAGGASVHLFSTDPANPLSGVGEQALTVQSGSTASFALPEPVELLEPADGATIGADTVFRWSPHPSGGRYDLQVQCHWTVNGEEHDVNYRELETELTERSLPAFPGVEIPSGTGCVWDVSWWDSDAPSFSVAGRDRQEHSSTSHLRSATFR